MPLIIRPERPEDYYQTEHMTQKAFWNLYNPGCNEHLLVHKLRSDPAYVPELSRVAELDGKIVGTIMYSRSKVVDGDISHEVLIFGPLCVEPALQKTGIGGALMQATFQLAREAGHKGDHHLWRAGVLPALRLCALRALRHHHRGRQEFRRLHGARARPRRRSTASTANSTRRRSLRICRMKKWMNSTSNSPIWKNYACPVNGGMKRTLGVFDIGNLLPGIFTLFLFLERIDEHSILCFPGSLPGRARHSYHL